MMFVIGINFAIRISDLLKLAIQDLLNQDLTFKDSILIREGKTQKPRYLYIVKPVQDAVMLYLNSLPSFSLSDPLFLSREKDSQGNKKSIGRSMAHKILSDLGDAINKLFG